MQIDILENVYDFWETMLNRKSLIHITYLKIKQEKKNLFITFFILSFIIFSAHLISLLIYQCNITGKR